MRAPCAAIAGVGGITLDERERALIRRANPLGFILFTRNCQAPDQVRALVADLRATVGRPSAPVLIDQEGGRVARLRPPHWPPRVAARAIGALAERDRAAGRAAAWLQARLIADDLQALGISVACAPVLDLGLPGQSEVVGDRAFSADPDIVAELGQASIEGFLAGGILPVIKHLPGHGRARVDSHVALPVVEAAEDVLEADWRPFRACREAPLGMSAHILYPALDPERPATLSPRIIQDVIRGRIGFQGLLLSDDLSMGALGGSLGTRAAQARAAGCDVALHCNGDFDELLEVLDAAVPLDGPVAARAARALDRARAAEPLDRPVAEARLSDLLERHVASLEAGA